MDMKNNTILITGGSSGIGLELARKLSKNNTVLICGRSQEKLSRAKEIIPSVNTFQCDLANETDCRNLAAWIEEKFPNCNILINNAAIVHTGEFTSIDIGINEARAEINVNFLAPIVLSKLLIPTLLQNDHAKLINVTTGLIYAPKSAYPFYNSTKAALHSFTQVLRNQMATAPLTIIEVMFPAVDTPWHNGAVPKIAIGVEPAVEDMLCQLKKDKTEIHVGKAGLLKWMARISPNFAIKQINRM